MKKLLTTFMMCLCMANGVAFAQDNTWNLTLFQDYKPAVVHMADGRNVKARLSNIFLKNASLLFKRGDATMEANMNPIVSVDFDTLHYVKIDNMLALEVDSVGANKLYCAVLIDLDSYKAMLRNNVNISSLSLGDQISYTTIDLTPPEGMQLPLVRHYFYLYNGEIFKVHEREITRRMPKEKKRMFRTIIGMSDFSWSEDNSLMKLLKAISE